MPMTLQVTFIMHESKKYNNKNAITLNGIYCSICLFGVKCKRCYCSKTPSPVTLSTSVKRVSFINQTVANIFFKALMNFSQKVLMQRFLFNFFIS